MSEALACGPAVHYQRTKHVALKYHFQRQLMLDGVIRLQHQSTTVQIADILTKDLDRVLHKKHRSVLFGDTPIEFISIAVPESQKIYCRRHNEEILRRKQTQELKQKFDDSNSKLEINSEVLLALSRAVETGKLRHYQLKKNQAEQALKACLRN